MQNRDEEAKNWREFGFSADEVAQLAAELGWRPIETIKALKDHFGVGLGDGKMLVDRTLDEPTRIATEYLRLQALLTASIAAPATEKDLEALAALERDGWYQKLFALV